MSSDLFSLLPIKGPISDFVTLCNNNVIVCYNDAINY